MKKKKKGYALVVVLLSLMALVITGTAVYSYVASTSRLNRNEREKEMLETAAKSGISIGQYYLINEKKFKEIKNNQEIISQEYIKNKINRSNFADVDVNGEGILDSYNYNIIIRKDKNIYTITSKVSKGNLTTEETNKISIS